MDTGTTRSAFHTEASPLLDSVRIKAGAVVSHPVFGTSFAVGQPDGRAVLGDVLDVGCCAQAVFVTLSCAS